jgi:site-specific recombinase XerD
MDSILSLFRRELEQLTMFSERTTTNYYTIACHFCDFLQKEHHTSLIDAKGFHLRQWMARQKKRVSRSRQTHHRSTLVHLFGFMQKMGLRPDNPATVLYPIRKVKSDNIQPICTRDAIKLLTALDRSTLIGERNYVMASILWALGLRINELVTLKVRDFEADHDPSHETGLLRVHGKGNKDRALFVVDRLYRVMTSYLRQIEFSRGNEAPLFPTEKGTAVSRDRIQCAIRNAARCAGIKVRVTPHILRHSFATEMYEQGVPVHDIRAMLGHENLDETSIYVHVSGRLKKDALRTMRIHGRS